MSGRNIKRIAIIFKMVSAFHLLVLIRHACQRDCHDINSTGEVRG